MACSRVVAEIDVKKLYGTVVAIPCVNVIGYLQYKREFADGRDLNRLFPGKEDGFVSQVYCYQLMNKVISQFNYLIDLHTASFGRINSYYVRADMVRFEYRKRNDVFNVFSYVFRTMGARHCSPICRCRRLFFTTRVRMVRTIVFRKKKKERLV